MAHARVRRTSRGSGRRRLVGRTPICGIRPDDVVAAIAFAPELAHREAVPPGELGWLAELSVQAQRVVDRLAAYSD